MAKACSALEYGNFVSSFRLVCLNTMPDLNYPKRGLGSTK